MRVIWVVYSAITSPKNRLEWQQNHWEGSNHAIRIPSLAVVFVSNMETQRPWQETKRSCIDILLLLFCFFCINFLFTILMACCWNSDWLLGTTFISSDKTQSGRIYSWMVNQNKIPGTKPTTPYVFLARELNAKSGFRFHLNRKDKQFTMLAMFFTKWGLPLVARMNQKWLFKKMQVIQ